MNPGKYVDPNDYVVILEQDPLIRPLLERWLAEAGYRVAAPGTESAKPALVIADIPDPQSAQTHARCGSMLLPSSFSRHVSGAVWQDLRRRRAGLE